MSVETLSNVGKYKILGEINRGSTGVVYRAELEGKHYALKILKTNNTANAARMRKETAAIARLNNPHLVQIVDASEIDGTPYIVMELLEGKNLSVLIKEGALSEKLSKQVATSITSALSEMHRFRMLHRDIKPANIVMTTEGVIKLVDLGLTADSAELQEEDQTAVVGTILYSSPEQCRILKRPVDGRSDLYSLGITLYECLTGKVPFDSKNAADIIKMHAAVRAPDLREQVPTISATFAAIIAKLIEKDPDDRYQSSEGLLHDLDNAEDIDAHFQSSGKLKLGVRDQILGTGIEIPVFGRDAELTALKKYLEDLKSNKGNAVILEGEGGCGKSRLTQEITNQATLNNHLILKAKCQLLGMQIPFAPIKEVLGQLVEKIKGLPDESEQQMWREWIQQSAGEAAGALCDFLPALKSLIGDAKGQALTSDESDKLKFFDDLLGFFGELAVRASGIVAVIDDIQWMDSSTSEFLTKLTQRLNQVPFYLMMTARNDRDSIEALNLFKTTTGRTLAPSIVLLPLEDASVGQIISAQIGKGSLDEVSVRRIAKAANGNPFAVIEYVRTLMASGHLAFADGQWQINQAGISTISLSKDIFQLVINRIDDLHPSAKNVLGLGAVIGNIFSLDVLPGASGLTVEQVIFALQEAEKNNLIETLSNVRYRFAHDRIREALTNSLSEEDRKNINDRLAAYLDGLPNREEHWFDLARHFSNGHFERNLPRAAEANYQAGVLAIANFSYAQAFDLLTFAFKCTQGFEAENAMKIAIARNLAIAASEVGKVSVAVRAIDFAVGLARSDDERVELKQIKIRAYYNGGRLLHAWIELKVTSEIQGWKFPKYGLTKWMQINWLLLLVGFKLITGWGGGRIHKDRSDRKHCETLSNLFYLGSCVARFRDRTECLLMLLKSLQFAILLGDKDRLARTLAIFVTLIAPFRFRSLIKLLIQYSRNLAEQAKNEATLANIEFAAETSFGTSGIYNIKNYRIRHAENAMKIPNLLGPYEFTIWANSFPGQLVMSGDNLEGLQSLQAYLPKIETMNSKWQIVSSLSALQQHLGQLGLLKELNEARAYQARLVEPDVKDLAMGLLWYSIAHFNTWLELGEVGTDTDFMIDVFLNLNVGEYYTRFVGMVPVVYIRLMQLEKSKTRDEARRARLKFKEMLHTLRLTSYSPLVQCHWHIAKAGLLRIEGKFNKALKRVEVGYQMARAEESRVGVFFATRERARIYHALGDTYRRDMEIALCLTIAEENHWTLRTRAIHEEFASKSAVPHNFGRSGTKTSLGATAVSGQTLQATMQATMQGTIQGTLQAPMQGTLHSSGVSHSRTTVGGQETLMSGARAQSVTKEERAMAALLAVSLASTQSSDPEQKSLAVLNEVIRLFGAERAFLFLTEDSIGLPGDGEKPSPQREAAQ